MVLLVFEVRLQNLWDVGQLSELHKAKGLDKSVASRNLFVEALLYGRGTAIPIQGQHQGSIGVHAQKVKAGLEGPPT